MQSSLSVFIPKPVTHMLHSESDVVFQNNTSNSKVTALTAFEFRIFKANGTRKNLSISNMYLFSFFLIPLSKSLKKDLF